MNIQAQRGDNYDDELDRSPASMLVPPRPRPSLSSRNSRVSALGTPTMTHDQVLNY
jgi:hypothetical protein